MRTPSPGAGIQIQIQIQNPEYSGSAELGLQTNVAACHRTAHKSADTKQKKESRRKKEERRKKKEEEAHSLTPSLSYTLQY